MSPRFRRYFLRSLPALLLILVFNWMIDLIAGDGFSPGLGFGIWLAVFMYKWAVRTEPNRRE